MQKFSHNIEIRATGTENQRKLTGVAIPYNSPSEDLGGFIEVVRPGALANSLSKGHNIPLLDSHQTNNRAVLGSTQAGTLRLTDTPEGLRFECDLPDTQAARDLWHLVKRGDVTGCSFGFKCINDKWTYQDGQELRELLEVELHELTIIWLPAYPSTMVEARKGGLKMTNAEREARQQLADLKEQRNKLDTESRELISKAETEKRSLTADEDKRSKEITEEVRTLNEKIEQLTERLLNREFDDKQGGIPMTMQKTDERQAINSWMRTGDTRALQVGDSEAGGVLAPQNLQAEIIKGIDEQVIMRQVARIVGPISGKSAYFPRLVSGVGAQFVAEGAEINPSDAQFDQVELVPKKLAALVPVSNELLADAGVDVAAFLAQHFAGEFAKAAESAYLKGDGTGVNPKGLLMQDGVTRVATKGATITVDDVLALWTALPTQYRNNAVFICGPELEAQLRQLKDAQGHYMLTPDLAGATPTTLLGRPLYVSSHMPELAAGADALLVGDFKQAVYVGDKANSLTLARSDAAAFTRDVTLFRATWRTDVALALPEALRILQIKGA